MPGTLFVVATPIGNLEDLTFRALRTLREADLIAAEDTRRTSKLLAHYEVRRPMVSLREHNEAREAPRLLDRIARGERVALVSDAGTPTIADPGTRLVRAAHERGLTVVPIPGPSAVTAALSASGLAEEQFVFLGFPPSSGNGRVEWFEALADEPRAVVFFESPHRIRRTLAELTAKSGERPIFVARELTKQHEQLVDQQNNMAASVPEIGEFTVVVGRCSQPDGSRALDLVKAHKLFGQLTELAHVEDEIAFAMVAAALSTRPSVVRKVIKKARILAKQQNQ